MAITGFSIDTKTSSLDIDKGLVIRGNYQTPGWEPFPTGTYQIYVLEETSSSYSNSPLQVTFSFTPNLFPQTGGKFTATPIAGTLPYANLATGDTVQFVFRNASSSYNVTTTSPVTILCFYPGTMIATPSGEAAVETLAIGDMVIRQDGTAAPIRWMGQSSILPPFADRMKALPIRIRKNALDDNVPCRDLLVSPAHAILVDGNLVQAGALINGSSITRETDVPMKFVYHHIELADHALVMAENTPAETFIDNVDRMAFDNWAEHEALYVDQPALVEMDLPRAKSQRQVPVATRDRLEERAVTLGYMPAKEAA